MYSSRLVRMIEDRAEQIAHAWVNDLQSNPRPPNYNILYRDELQRRVYEVYRNLGRWFERFADTRARQTAGHARNAGRDVRKRTRRMETAVA